MSWLKKLFGGKTEEKAPEGREEDAAAPAAETPEQQMPPQEGETGGEAKPM